jgi:hypothetical protein
MSINSCTHLHETCSMFLCNTFYDVWQQQKGSERVSLGARHDAAD